MLRTKRLRTRCSTQLWLKPIDKRTISAGLRDLVERHIGAGYSNDRRAEIDMDISHRGGMLTLSGVLSVLLR